MKYMLRSEGGVELSVSIGMVFDSKVWYIHCHLIIATV